MTDWADDIADEIMRDFGKYPADDVRSLIAARIRLVQAEAAKDEVMDIYQARIEREAIG